MGSAGMDGEQPAQSDVTWYLYGVGVEVLVRSAHLDHLSTSPEAERQQEAGPQMILVESAEEDMKVMKMTMMAEGERG